MAFGVADPPHSGVWYRQGTAEAVGVAPRTRDRPRGRPRDRPAGRPSNGPRGEPGDPGAC